MLGADMRPSNTVFDPGLERGAPWGRDLFTFVTSAAGYMMRTLQKPRKNKPSKRQVNHRRFLHNMIQRKFAEIEAANQQLASALFTVESETQRPSDAHKSSQTREPEKNTNNAGETKTPTKHQDKDNDDDTRKLHILVDNSSKSHLNIKHSNNLNSKTDSQSWIREEHLLGRLAQDNSDFTSEWEQLHAGPAISHKVFLEDSVITSPQIIEEINQNSNTQILKCPNEEQEKFLGLSCFDISLASLESPLSLDSFDFNVQPNSEKSVQIPNITDSLEMDVMENFDFLDFSEGTGGYIPSQNVGAVWHVRSEESQSFFRDSPAILNTLYEDQGDGDATGRLQQIRSLSENSEWTLNSENGSENNIAYFGSSCNKDQTKPTGATMDVYQHQPGVTALINKADQYSLTGSWSQSETIKKSFQPGDISNHSQAEYGHSDQFQTTYWEQQIQEDQDHTQSMENNPYSVLMDEKFDLNPDYPEFLSHATAHCYSINNSNCTKDSCSYTSIDHDQSFPSFDGVAQSFPVPVQNLNPYPVSTPHLNDDWLFGSIVADDDSDSTVRSPGCTYCWRSCTKSNECAIVLE
ncbi:uncharacterized protein LOC134310192 [Trichomycterus rosablanca]|uniref:uncharacterized protein LOC134310192 n=1 Tax=Trichomycterus rosablanca TaxID=2290929 RepID=UPI002F34FAA5